MLLIDASKLGYVRALKNGLLKVVEISSPEEFKAVKSPIKVKLAHDVLVLLFAELDDYDRPTIRFSVLNSTQRKFKDDYVAELLSKVAKYDRGNAICWFATPEELKPKGGTSSR